MAKPSQFSAFSFSGIGLSLTHQPSAHGFLPSSRSIQLLNPHSHAITPVFSFWARRHEQSLSHKQAHIQARRVLERLLLWARPNRWFNSDPTCTIWFHISSFGFLVFVHPRAAGWARLTFFVRPRSPFSFYLPGVRGSRPNSSFRHAPTPLLISSRSFAVQEWRCCLLSTYRPMDSCHH